MQQQVSTSQDTSSTNHMSSSWLASKILRNSEVTLPPQNTENGMNRLGIIANDHDNLDVSPNGDICLFHSPSSFTPKLTVEEMERAFQLIAEIGRVYSEGGSVYAQAMLNNSQTINEQYADMDTLDDDVQQYFVNASQRARDRIARIQFNWYQFEEMPKSVVGLTYRNLQHVDIRQNGTLYKTYVTLHVLSELKSLV